MSNKFIIFGQERSGTTSLISALNRNNNVVHEPLSSLSGDICGNEKFNLIIKDMNMLPDKMERSKHIPYFNKYNDFSMDYNLLSKYLDKIFDIFDGVKHIWCTVAEAGNENLINYCKKNKIKILFQYRMSLFDPAVSWQLGSQTNVWQLGENLENKNKVDNFKFLPLKEHQIKKRMIWYENMLNSYRLLIGDDNSINVSYEALFDENFEFRVGYFQNICTFLGINNLDKENVENFIFNKNRKVYTKKHYSEIENYDEMYNKYGNKIINLK